MPGVGSNIFIIHQFALIFIPKCNSAKPKDSIWTRVNSNGNSPNFYKSVNTYCIFVEKVLIWCRWDLKNAKSSCIY